MTEILHLRDRQRVNIDIFLTSPYLTIVKRLLRLNCMCPFEQIQLTCLLKVAIGIITSRRPRKGIDLICRPCMGPAYIALVWFHVWEYNTERDKTDHYYNLMYRLLVSYSVSVVVVGVAVK